MITGIYEGNSALALFDAYEKELPSKQKYITDLLNIYKEHKCIVVTCPEKEPGSFYRSRLVKFLKINFKDL
jgi:hypothetical protein